MSRLSSPKYLRVSAALLLAFSPVGKAMAAQEVLLASEQSQIVQLPAAPATLVVGNPAIADATTDGRMLFFHPKGIGVTNVVALDAKGHKLGDYLVRVIFDDTYSVSQFSPGMRQTYLCRKDCDPVMRIGDEYGFFDVYKKQAEAKNTLAGTQALGEDMLLPSSGSSGDAFTPTPTAAR